MSITFRTDPNYTADLYTFLKNAEGSVPHVYIDSYGNATIVRSGVGPTEVIESAMKSTEFWLK